MSFKIERVKRGMDAMTLMRERERGRRGGETGLESSMGFVDKGDCV